MYVDQSIIKGCQPIGGHVSYPTDSPNATRLGLWNRLVISSPIFWAHMDDGNFHRFLEAIGSTLAQL